MLLCIDCQHCAHDDDGHLCRHPSYRSLVTGAMQVMLCAVARTEKGTCGPEGRLWTAKPPGEPGMLPPGVLVTIDR